MKKRIVIIAFLGLTLFHLGAMRGVNTSMPKSGDLIFQTSLSAQSQLIQTATRSPYSHCGIVYKEGNVFYVLEAVQPVKSTPLTEWIAQGKNKHYVIKRLKNADRVLTDATLNAIKQEGRKFLGKDYDLAFEWSDERIYCSELIWKIYQRATGIEIGRLQTLRDFDVDSERVNQELKKRYGNDIPWDETFISPAAIFESDQLIPVKVN